MYSLFGRFDAFVELTLKLTFAVAVCSGGLDAATYIDIFSTCYVCLNDQPFISQKQRIQILLYP
jgi:hypothetical protein